jgi:hypothetical protein
MKYAISAALFCLLLSAPARAQDIGPKTSAQDIEVGTTIVCDIQHEVERFVALMRGNARSANSAVNTISAEENDRNASGVSKLAFRRGATLATVRTRDETFEIAEILVVGHRSRGAVGDPERLLRGVQGGRISRLTSADDTQPIFCSFFKPSSQGQRPGINV